MTAIREATLALDKATRRFAELMMDAAVSTALRGKTMNTAGEQLDEAVTAPHPMARGGVQIRSQRAASIVPAPQKKGFQSYERSKPAKNIPPDKLVRVTFMPEGKTVEFEFGTLPYDHHGKPMSFLDVAENFGIFLDHACGGVCACTTCHLWIKDQDGISPADDDEIDRMDMAADQQLNSRLGCQAVITKPGNYVVEIPKWNRNYTSEGKPLALAEGK